jgi:hypothetical protein
MKKLLVILLLNCSFASLFAQTTFNITGKITDETTGEELVGVTVFVEKTTHGAISDLNGNFSLSLNPGNYVLTFSYLGFENQIRQVSLKQNTKIDIKLSPSVTQLSELEVTGTRADANVSNVSMGTQKLNIESIRKMPALMGEVDVIKSIQLLPGVQAASEGSSGFSVRGGGTDQNLILLDDAVIYNASHLMGFFSVFNNDVVEDATLYKGDIPANFGDRLSSVLDVQTKDPSINKYKGSGGIGLIASRFAIEGPIVKNKLSFMLAGRRTYADLFLPLINKDLKDTKLFFYDLNGKITYDINHKNKIFVSGYHGKDKFGMDLAGMNFGNSSATARWIHAVNNSLSMHTSFVFSQYSYGMSADLNELGFEWTSKIQDYSLKLDFTQQLGIKNTLRFGLGSTYHFIDPARFINSGMSDIVQNIILDPKRALAHHVYVTNEQTIIKSKLSAKYGVRVTAFQNIGEEKVYSYDNDFNKLDSITYGEGKIYNTFWAVEPRLGLVYLLPSINSSIKAAYSHTAQNMQLSSNSTGGMPMDIWFPSNPNIKPQQSDQYTLGFFKNFFDNKLETSIEGYYKTFSNLIDFKDNPSLIMNPYLETEILTGKGRSYGLEVLVRKNEGKISGWLSYTYSRSFRTVEGINFGQEYSSPYDRPHNFVAVLSYDITPRINLSANWIYNTGQPVTYPIGKMEFGNVQVPIYSGERNKFRYKDYHRMDLSINIKGKDKPGKFWHSEWNISIYNVYGRKNNWAIMFVEDKDNPGRMKTQMVYLFSVVPSVTYNFYF